jgi:HK97 family phage major capsid protein
MDPNIRDLAALQEELRGTVKDFSETNTKLKAIAASAEKQMKEAGDLNSETKKQADENLSRFSALAAQIGDIEQKIAKKSLAISTAPLTPGQAFIESDIFKAIGGSDKVGRASYRITVPHASLQMGHFGHPLNYGVVSSLTPGAGGYLVEPMLLPPVMAPMRRMTIRNLCSPGRTISNALKYVQESGFTNNTEVVTETTLKPESNITFTLVTGNVATIAHWIAASKQILDDAPALRSMIDTRLRYGLQLEEEDQFLNGDGTGDNILGIRPQATAFTTGLVPVFHKQRIDEIRIAILQVFLAEYAADGIVMHPSDWAGIELTKDTTGNYIWANPAGVQAKTLWGLPVVDTQSMTDNSFLVGAFALGAQIFDREDANVAVSTEDRDNFIRNMVTILAEERTALAVYRPAAFVTGPFTVST